MKTPRLSRLVQTLLLACLGTGVTAVAGEVYRWTDAGGQVHFEQGPPRDRDAQRLDMHESRPRAERTDPPLAERRDRQQRLLESFEYERDRKRAAALRERSRQNRNAGYCDELRLQWRRLNHPGPIFHTRADGGRDYLSDAQREGEKDKLRPAYREACGEEP
ncbi:MAG: DUF4124 domain-containing protein [Chromatiaceae bacterium]|nr:DUF4124 domain-containing protein [Gammaproteobacteria bacterium]MCP5300355.1 DUF4124 domain-containing protein [Chromatiaceae bacterium]MCP5422427.1 DUF4124 domain-containing protein [Chromatiaceae bacterium]